MNPLHLPLGSYSACNLNSSAIDSAATAGKK
jgi:hypothetical protein